MIQINLLSRPDDYADQMKPLYGNFVLPQLQEKLDALGDGDLLQISRRDYERLFGANDVARARVRNFASGHACVASFADGAILFRKTLKKVADRSAAVKGDHSSALKD